jgi:hypothetical protein
MVRIIYILGIMHAYKCPDSSASAPDARTALHFPYAPALYACLAFRTLTRDPCRPDVNLATRLRAGTARAPSRFPRASHVQHPIYL